MGGMSGEFRGGSTAATASPAGGSSGVSRGGT
jgi:hypothetical protein